MALAPPNDFAATPRGTYRPPAPVPRDKPMGPIALAWALATNPLECWTREHFEKPIVRVGLPIGEAVLVHEPGAMPCAPGQHRKLSQRRIAAPRFVSRAW